MNKYTGDYIQKYPKETKKLLGIDYDQLEKLITWGKWANQRKKEAEEKKKIRLIKAGGGNHHKLPEEVQIILMLIYLRQNPSFQMLGLLFQVSESTAHNLFNYWLEIFQNEWPESLFEPLKKFPEELEKVREELSQYDLIVDTMEQVIERPRD